MDPDLRKLLCGWHAHELNQAELAPILVRLKADDEFRSKFVEEISLLGQLKAVQSSEPRWLEIEDLLATSLDAVVTEEDFESRVMQSIPAVQNIGSSSQSKNPAYFNGSWLAIVTALLAIAALAIWWNSKPVSSLVDPSQVVIRDRGDSTTNQTIASTAGASVEAVAVLGQCIDAVWGGNISPALGDSLQPGDLILKSGLVQIEFLTGVRLLIRAPADLELRSADEILLRHGAASCFVTEMGRGFRIVTKEMEVIDVGTAFSIGVEKGQQPEVHVIEGSVEINSPKRETMELKELHAIQMSDEGPQNVAYSPERFPQPAELRDQQLERARDRYKAWQSLSGELSKDPAVMLHYNFQEPDPNANELTNRALVPNGTDGAVIGCRWTEGRWPSKRALLYRNGGDRVLFQVPGKFESVTFLAWVRIDALTQETTSIMMTESPVRRKKMAKTNGRIETEAMARRATSDVKTVRWELGQSSSHSMFAIGYGARIPSQWKYDAITVDQPATRTTQWGNWACLAVTCEVFGGDVIHYFNGKRIGSGELTRAEPLLLDFMELGNFGVTHEELKRTEGASQRRFYGAIDEVIIAKRVFSDTELAEIWNYGKR